MSLQRDWDEGGDPDQWSAQRSALLQEGFLLHHAGRHAAAPPHGAGGHDGTNDEDDDDDHLRVYRVHTIRVSDAAVSHHPLLSAGLSQPKAAGEGGGSQRDGEFTPVDDSWSCH